MTGHGPVITSGERACGAFSLGRGRHGAGGASFRGRGGRGACGAFPGEAGA